MCIIEVISNKEIAYNVDLVLIYSPILLRKHNTNTHYKFETNWKSDFWKFEQVLL